MSERKELGVGKVRENRPWHEERSRHNEYRETYHQSRYSLHNELHGRGLYIKGSGRAAGQPITHEDASVVLLETSFTALPVQVPLVRPLSVLLHRGTRTHGK